MRLRVQRNKMNIFKRCTRSSGATLSKAQYLVNAYEILATARLEQRVNDARREAKRRGCAIPTCTQARTTKKRSMSQRTPTWIIGQDSVCIWYIILFHQKNTDRPAPGGGSPE